MSGEEVKLLTVVNFKENSTVDGKTSTRLGPAAEFCTVPNRVVPFRTANKPTDSQYVYEYLARDAPESDVRR
jgi:hypothetical protein